MTDPEPTSKELIARYEEELVRLDALFVDLEALWEKVPRLMWAAILAPAVAYYASLGWALVELLMVAVLVGSQAYLLALRKSENRWNRAQVASDLARLRSERS